MAGAGLLDALVGSELEPFRDGRGALAIAGGIPLALIGYLVTRGRRWALHLLVVIHAAAGVGLVLWEAAHDQHRVQFLWLIGAWLLAHATHLAWHGVEPDDGRRIVEDDRSR